MSAPLKTVKIGDVVHVRGTVVNVSDKSFQFSIDPEKSAYWELQRDIVHVEPRPLKIGDIVRVGRLSNYRGHVGEILAVHDGTAWVRGAGLEYVDNLVSA